MSRNQRGVGREDRGSIKTARLAVATLTFCAWAFSGPFVAAGIFNFSGTSVDGHPVSGSADFTLNAGADTITVKLTNTTATTNDAGELFTGLDFTVGGLTPTMTSDTGVERTVDGSGGFTDSAPGQNLTWSLVSLGSGTYQLNFNPDAKHAILGPPTAGSYSGANGSIKGNPGHTPFTAQVATFVLSVPNLEANTPVIAKVFRYGTNLDPATGTIVPEPTTAALLLAAGIVAVTRRKRRIR